MKNLLMLLAATVLGANNASAAFHLWDIQEVYSNADGTVQYVEFFTSSNGQEFLSGHTLASTGATTLTFPASLPLNSPLAGHPNTASSTGNQTFLVATSNFTALYNVVPDYILPAGFLQSGSGKLLNFNSGTDTVNLTSLPIGGTQSLNADIADANPASFTINSIGSPKNFRGETALVPEPTTVALAAAGCVLLFSRRKRSRS